jgi:penicillin-binding protein 1C
VTFLKSLLVAGGLVVVGSLVLIGQTLSTLKPLPETLHFVEDELKKVQVLDRNGTPLSITYHNDWNIQDQRSLNEIPRFLRESFIFSEDRRFYAHHGVDWWARLHSVWQNLMAGRFVRGASTITEQVVRMLHPRPRSIWSRWVEGLEAELLEARFSKQEILEFYLNQVPYGGRRRGIAQAARYYWDRDLDTLSRKEMLALVVMVRSPARLDLRRNIEAPLLPVERLSKQLALNGIISEDERSEIIADDLTLAEPVLPSYASHFVNYVNSLISNPKSYKRGRVLSTIDGPLQRVVSEILESRIKDLEDRDVADGAVLIVDNSSGEVLAWVNSGDFANATPGSQIDAVLTPRQPGSTLKPFLYALAISRGWTASTLIKDAPLSQAVGLGIHNYRNYSRTYYGELRVREALGNSLNVPAVKAIKFIGKAEFLRWLKELGLSSLRKSSDFYGEGLALGNGEVSLFELVGAYRAIANHGVYSPLTVIRRPEDEPIKDQRCRVMSSMVSSLIADILSDPQARRREFGSGGILQFPVQTAVKTGTSNDYRDAWAIGFSENFTVGVWMGNLNRLSMREVSGAIGPALVLRSVFAELNRRRDTRGLYLSPELISRSVCAETGKLANPECPAINEWFLPHHEPEGSCHRHVVGTSESHDFFPADPLITLPTPGLQMAMDPRIPDSLEYFPFEIDSEFPLRKAEWLVDGKPAGTSSKDKGRYLWQLKKGKHIVQARVWSANESSERTTQEVGFRVR